MKQYNGKRLKIWAANGLMFEGICTGADDEFVRLLPEGETDEIAIHVHNIFAHSVVGEGVSGGYSGLKTYVCKNTMLNCMGKCLVSSKECTLADMNCEICRKHTEDGTGFKCDFGCVGAIEVLPSKVQRVLFDGMIADRNKKKNYLDEAKKDVNRDIVETLQREGAIPKRKNYLEEAKKSIMMDSQTLHQEAQMNFGSLLKGTSSNKKKNNVPKSGSSSHINKGDEQNGKSEGENK